MLTLCPFLMQPWCSKNADSFERNKEEYTLEMTELHEEYKRRFEKTVRRARVSSFNSHHIFTCTLIPSNIRIYAHILICP